MCCLLPMATGKYAEPEAAYKEFKAVVNMSPARLENWLKTEESKSVGITRPGETESIGRQSGKKIIKLLKKKKAELTVDDYKHMRKVISYVKRHMGQGPHSVAKVPESRWRYSLMNWGHDPLE